MTWKVQQQIEWRRAKVLEYASQGLNQKEIAEKLKVDESTISRDLAFLSEQARHNIKHFIEEKLPLEFEKCLTSIDAVKRNAWLVAEESANGKLKLQALALVKDCASTTMDLLTNSAAVDDAVRFVEDSTGVKATSMSSKVTVRAKAKENTSNSGSGETRTPDGEVRNDIRRSEEKDSIIGAGRTATANKVF